jgi:hypothetical protein
MAMGDPPQMLVCNRLTDMFKVHPQQDNTHKCSKCETRVGIYPSGQKALTRWPNMAIVCVPCAVADSKPDDKNLPAGTVEEILQEARESKPMVQQ